MATTTITTSAARPRRRPPQFEAVQARQHHIEHHDIRRVLTDGVQRSLTGPSRAHPITEPAQSKLKALPGTGVILNKQHFSHRPPLCLRCSAGQPRNRRPG